MRNMMKKRIALACMLAVGVSAVAGGVAANVSAGAEGSTFTLYDGASIRTANPAGIRFETTISGEEYAAYVAQEAKFGTVIIPESKLGANTLEVGLAGSLNIVAENFVEVVEDNEETTDVNESVMQYNAVLVGKYDEQTNTYAGLPKEMYNVKLVARSYVQVGTEAPVYATNTVTRSMAQVAGKAIADTTETYDADEYEYMHDITEYVATLGANTLTAVKVNTAKETLNASISLPDACGEVYGVYVMANDSTVPTSAYAVEGNVVTFTDAFLKSLDYGKYTLKINAENGCYSVETEMYGEVAATPDTTIGFDNNTQTEYVANETEWLASYQNAIGVAKVSVSTEEYADMNFVMPQEMVNAIIADTTWEKMIIRVYIPSEGLVDDSAVKTPEFFMDGAKTYWSGGFAYDTWKRIEIARSYFDDAFLSNLATGKTFIERNGACGNDSAHFYIDYIDFAKAPEIVNGMLLDFSKEKQSSYMVNVANPGQLANFEGAKGVGYAKVTDGTWNTGYNRYALPYTLEQLQKQEWDYLEIREMLVDSDPSTGTYTVKNDGVAGGYASWTATTDGNWRLYRLTKENALAAYTTLDAFYDNLMKGTHGFFIWNAEGKYVCVDYIQFKTYDGELLEFNTATQAARMTAPANATYLETFNNATGVAKATATDNWGNCMNCFKVPYTAAELALMDWDYIEVRETQMKDDGTYLNTAGGSPEGFSSNTLGWTKTDRDADGWICYRLTKEAALEACGDIATFYNYLINGTMLFRLYNVNGYNVYVDYIRFVKNA